MPASSVPHEPDLGTARLTAISDAEAGRLLHLQVPERSVQNSILARYARRHGSANLWTDRIMSFPVQHRRDGSRGPYSEVRTRPLPVLCDLPNVLPSEWTRSAILQHTFHLEPVRSDPRGETNSGSYPPLRVDADLHHTTAVVDLLPPKGDTSLMILSRDWKEQTGGSPDHPALDVLDETNFRVLMSRDGQASVTNQVDSIDQITANGSRDCDYPLWLRQSQEEVSRLRSQRLADEYPDPNDPNRDWSVGFHATVTTTYKPYDVERELEIRELEYSQDGSYNPASYAVPTGHSAPDGRGYTPPDRVYPPSPGSGSSGAWGVTNSPH